MSIEKIVNSFARAFSECKSASEARDLFKKKIEELEAQKESFRFRFTGSETCDSEDFNCMDVRNIWCNESLNSIGATINESIIDTKTDTTIVEYNTIDSIATFDNKLCATEGRLTFPQNSDHNCQICNSTYDEYKRISIYAKSCNDGTMTVYHFIYDNITDRLPSSINVLENSKHPDDSAKTEPPIVYHFTYDESQRVIKRELHQDGVKSEVVCYSYYPDGKIKHESRSAHYTRVASHIVSTFYSRWFNKEGDTIRIKDNYSFVEDDSRVHTSSADVKCKYTHRKGNTICRTVRTIVNDNKKPHISVDCVITDKNDNIISSVYSDCLNECKLSGQMDNCRVSVYGDGSVENTIYTIGGPNTDTYAAVDYVRNKPICRRTQVVRNGVTTSAQFHNKPKRGTASLIKEKVSFVCDGIKYLRDVYVTSPHSKDYSLVTITYDAYDKDGDPITHIMIDYEVSKDGIKPKYITSSSNSYTYSNAGNKVRKIFRESYSDSAACIDPLSTMYYTNSVDDVLRDYKE